MMIKRFVWMAAVFTVAIFLIIGCGKADTAALAESETPADAGIEEPEEEKAADEVKESDNESDKDVEAGKDEQADDGSKSGEDAESEEEVGLTVENTSDSESGAGSESDKDAEARKEEEERKARIAEPHNNEDFVLVTDYIPNAYIELRYATENNFTGQVIYDFDEAYLRYGTVLKLADAAERLAEDGYAIKIWDAFRPTYAQFVLWEVCPISTYVADPYHSFSSHSRGNTVDMTIVTEDGGEVEMPTEFDSFSALADRDYSDCTDEAAKNARYLEQIMSEYGFVPYSGEWWHFADAVSYPPEETFKP